MEIFLLFVRRLVVLCFLPMLLIGTKVNASETERFAYLAQNPLAPIFSIPIEYTNYGGAQNGNLSIGSIKPIIPVSLGDWNMINQLALNFIGSPGVINGVANLPEPYPGNGAYGLGDTTLTTYFSPKSTQEFTWGIGPTFVFPTDTRFNDIEDRTSRQLGSGKFSLGPAFMLVTQPKPWSLGLAVKQIWSVVGSKSRHGVSEMILQPFVNYNLTDGWYLSSDMDVVGNWNRASDQTWTVPLGGGVGKLFQIGENAINTKLEAHYNVVRPNLSPDWSANLAVQVMFGK